MAIRLIDLETTGTDSAVDKICEIAALDLVRDSMGIVMPGKARQHLCNPGIPMPPQASAVHHLIDADLAHQPPLSAVIDEYRGADAYVAHNAPFEKGFLEPLLGTVTWICTYRVALRLWPDAPGHSNQTLRYWLGIVDPFGLDRTLIDPHRALSDCYVTGAIFVDMIRKARWGDMVRWSAEPALHTKLTFGKHRGERYDAVPADYLDWIISQPEMDEDKKFSASHWLKLRSAAA